MLPKTIALNRTIAASTTWRSTPSTIPFCRAFNARKSPQIGSTDEESFAIRTMSKTQLRKLPPPLENVTGSGGSTIGQTRNASQQRQQSTGARIKGIFKSDLTAEPFLTGTSSNYIEDMYVLWKLNPHNVHKSWDAYFRRVKAGLKPGEAYNSPFEIVQKNLQSVTPSLVDANLDMATLADHLNVHSIIRSYQSHGHRIADLDPLNIYSADLEDSVPPELIIENYKFSEKDLERSFMLPRSTYIGGSEQFLTLREILRRLKTVYCGHTGIEYMYMTNSEQLDWLRKRLETPYANEITSEGKTNLLKRIIKSFEFEDFMAKKYPSEKRFGVEGCEALIPAIKQIIDRATVQGVDSFIIGMPHRGRLNLLANVARRPLESIFAQFNTLEPADEGSGDVKYHLGFCVNMINRFSNKMIDISVVANPSHLEAVDPVVQGKTRARQFYNNDPTGNRSMSILLHGDAAFAGQGVVYETFHLSALPAYTTHGSIHIVVNNQIGFTTDPRFSRSSHYSTDVARVVNCPIFHVNADDPEAIVNVCNIATEYRQRFKKDVVIDLVCYRRHGHNELDEPMFTQPLMYSRIKQTKNIFTTYSDKLLKEGVVTKKFVEDEVAHYSEILENAYVAAQKMNVIHNRDWLDSPWDDFFKHHDPLRIKSTGVNGNVLQRIGQAMSTVPDGYSIHPGLARTLKGRAEMLARKTTDWALGEAFAFGSLLCEGIHVRLSGQDCERGTFSHRHHVLHDQKIDKRTYVPLNRLGVKQAPYSICNSSLSEYAVLGFELGYSMTKPDSLVLWEAQFGDFANTGQCVIDQFISSGQTKWIRQSGLVLLLPHGLEGMGPEHSSARPERFLQMCNDDEEHKIPESPTFVAQQLYDANWIVANCTTPASFFHILRRQVAMSFRKPLVILTPKSLLRHPQARSPISEYLQETSFQRMIFEPQPANPKRVERLVFCTGKIYYELAIERDVQLAKDRILIQRLEQISPFPYDLVKKIAKLYPNAELVWSQEEHKNNGAWTYVQPRFQTALGGRTVKYAGRMPAASPATGNKFQHLHEQRSVIASSLNIHPSELKTAPIK